jgi:hypothetical protein
MPHVKMKSGRRRRRRRKRIKSAELRCSKSILSL